MASASHFSNKDGQLFVTDVKSKSVRQVADDRHGQLNDFTWSPHGGHLAFTLTDDNEQGSIHIWSVESGETQRVTGPAV